MQGEQHTQTARALRNGDLDAADITPTERLLREFVETLTRHAYKITDEQVQGLREVGWTDPQIAEAVYNAALFNFLSASLMPSTSSHRQSGTLPDHPAH